MKTIVIIDDSMLVLKLTRMVLEGAGYHVQTLSDPDEFQPTKTGTPDLLLVDMNLPTSQGDDIVTYIKSRWNLATPILLFSTIPEAELAEAVARCGATGYISKQWGMEEMIASVEAVIGP